MELSQNNFNSIHGTNIIGNVAYTIRKDYEDYCISKNWVKSNEELWRNKKLVIDVQKHWFRKGQEGCVFAQAISTNFNDKQWVREVYFGDSKELIDTDTLGKIERSIEKAKRGKSNELISFLFPNIIDEVDFVSFLKHLSKSNVIRLNQEIVDLFVILSYRLQLKSEVIGWVVGFGPFLFLPKTRQSPCVELTIRTKEKPDKIFSKLNQDRKIAHLADVPTGMSDDVAEVVLASTIKKVEETLGGKILRQENRFAKAKVTFNIPITIW